MIHTFENDSDQHLLIGYNGEKRSFYTGAQLVETINAAEKRIAELEAGFRVVDDEADELSDEIDSLRNDVRFLDKVIQNEGGRVVYGDDGSISGINWGAAVLAPASVRPRV